MLKPNQEPPADQAPLVQAPAPDVDALAERERLLAEGMAALEVQRKELEEKAQSMASQSAAIAINPNAKALSAGEDYDGLVEMPVRDPKRHYTNVPAPVEGQFDSPIHQYLAMPSPSQPGRRMYRIESKDPMVTGDARVWSLSCLTVDYDETLRTFTRESSRKVEAIAPPRPPEFNGVEGQEYNQINRTALGHSGLIGIEPGQNPVVTSMTTL